MKRLFYVTLAIFTALAMITGCAQSAGSSGNAPQVEVTAPDNTETADAANVLPYGGSDEGKALSVVCTIFPQYDWTRQILGDRAGGTELTLLQTSSVDLHSFQPSVSDIITISSCDLFIYVGGESDLWVADALKEAVNKDMVVINLLETLGDKAVTEEIVEGMEEEEGNDHGEEEHSDENHVHDEVHSDEDHAHDEVHTDEDHTDEDHTHDEDHAHEEEHAHEEDHADEGEHTHDGEPVLDEHVWLSVNNAQIFCDAIYSALSSLDAANAPEYEANLNAYKEKLAGVDASYREGLASTAYDTLVFGDRFPFRYLVDDYGIEYFAAFPGCSAETEASFETIIFLANKTDELNLDTLMVTESSDKSIAGIIASSTKNGGQRILSLNSIQSVSANDAETTDITYLALMEENLETLKEALN